MITVRDILELIGERAYFKIYTGKTHPRTILPRFYESDIENHDMNPNSVLETEANLFHSGKIYSMDGELEALEAFTPGILDYEVKALTGGLEKEDSSCVHIHI